MSQKPTLSRSISSPGSSPGSKDQEESALIKLSNVALTLASRAGEIEILRDINISIERGETVGIVGPSGSGKTSLLMIMAGLERVTKGRVYFRGQEISGLGEDELAVVRGAHMGIVFQSFNLVPTMTALENVALPLEFSGAPEPFLQAEKRLDEVGLSHRHDHFPAQLSGGECQRVALARALAPCPSLLLADEPTGNLDGRTGSQVIDLLFGLHKIHKAALVLITHDEALAARCQRQIRMEDGCVESDAPNAENSGEAAR